MDGGFGERERKLHYAAIDIFPSISFDCGLNGNCDDCDYCDHWRQVSRYLFGAIIRCVDFVGNVSGVGFRCAEGFAGELIQIDRLVVDDIKKTPCGNCLEGLLFHEYLHLRIFHESGDSDTYHTSPLWGQVHKCFPCALPVEIGQP